jgi:DNA-binding SARP family transcriptional activator/predicted ATPase
VVPFLFVCRLIDMIHIQLLGSFRLTVGDEVGAETVVDITVPRVQALLAYLALHRHTPHSRQQLAFLLWPESSEAQAFANLRGEILKLRQLWPQAEEYLDIQRQSLQWRPETAITLDVTEFEQLVTQAERAVQGQQVTQAVAALEQGVALYRGPLLPTCYDDWVRVPREAVDQQVIQALHRLAGLLEIQGDYPHAIQQAQRLLRHDPLQEAAYQQLMRLYSLQGDRVSALRAYHECVAVLARELDVEPSAETQALYAQLMHEGVAQASAVHLPGRSSEPATLVGRQVEWQQLLLAWQRANQGQAQMVVAAGEAGIGKTRLVEAFAAWVRRQGVRVAIAHCYAAEGELAFTPLIELLRAETVLETLPALEEVWLAQVARLLPELAAERPHLIVAEPVADSLQRQRFFEALARAVLGAGRSADARSLLLVVDDLQWADRETLEWLHYLLRYAPQARLLVVGTARSEETLADHPLQGLLRDLRRQQRLVEIELGRLNEAETAALAAQVAGHEVAADVAAALYAQTEGNPLFVVETVRAQQGWGPADERVPSSLPQGIQAVIQARLAQLSPLAQEVAQLAAAVGRAFSVELLARVGSYPEEELLQSLDELWQRRILQEQGVDGYDFSHARLRDVAYSQISPLRRRLLHRRLAEALEQVSPQGVDAVSGLIAAHYELGDLPVQAIHFYQRAARFASNAYAHQEAAEALKKAFALLPAFADAEERRHQELELQLALGGALMQAKGWSHREAQQAYDRALVLCQVAGTDVQRFDAAWGLHEIYLFQAHGPKALEASQICWELAQQTGDPELLLQAHHAFWGVYRWFYLGVYGLQAVMDHAQQGIALYRPEWHRAHVLRFGGHDPGVCAHDMLAEAQCLLGYPDQAVETRRSALRLAGQLDDPFTWCNSLISEARLYTVRGEPIRTLPFLDQVAARLREQEIPMLKAQELTWRGWALGQITPGEEAIALVRQGIALWRQLGIPLDQPEYWIRLAETCIKAGDFDVARQATEEGLAIARATGEENFRSELYRLRGQCLLAAGELEAAQADLQQALATAQAQRAKWLELRAAMDLSQLWADQGRRTEAHALVAGIYGWFTEGFETADLRRAQALLAELAP